MEANLKYTKFFYYDKETNLVIDENKRVLPKTDIIYEILKKYNTMLKILDDVLVVPNKSIKEADNNLVYKGKDKKGRYQYCYGVNYVKNRSDKKLENFLKIYNKMNTIEKIIEDGLKEKEINKSFLFSAILLLELTFFIRLGKEIYMEENETIGILTLKKKNIIIKNDVILITFKAKSNKQQEFICENETQPILFSVLTKLYHNAKKDDDYIFTTNNEKHFSERMLNKRLKDIGLRLKDFRTYGVNILFLKTIYDNLYVMPKNNIKKLINLGINDAAKIIGHSKNISKKSYLSDKLIEVTEIVLQENKDIKDFETFIKKIINKCLK